MKIQESKPENQGRVRNGCRPEIQESKPLKKTTQFMDFPTSMLRLLLLLSPSSNKHLKILQTHR